MSKSKKSVLWFYTQKRLEVIIVLFCRLYFLSTGIHPGFLTPWNTTKAMEWKVLEIIKTVLLPSLVGTPRHERITNNRPGVQVSVSFVTVYGHRFSGPDDLVWRVPGWLCWWQNEEKKEWVKKKNLPISKVPGSRGVLGRRVCQYLATDVGYGHNYVRVHGPLLIVWEVPSLWTPRRVGKKKKDVWSVVFIDVTNPS